MLKRLPYLLSPVLALAIAAAIHFLPFSHAEGDFWNNMRDALRTGHTVSTFLPGFYPYLCSLLYKPFGEAGIETFQAAIYLALAACTWFSIRRCTSQSTLAVLAACIVMLNPDLLSSIPKLWDTEITALLLATLFALCLALDSGGGAAVSAIGIVWGLGLAVRPNFALLALPIGYALWKSRGGRAACISMAGVTGLAFATLAAANTVAHGSFYLPSNGPYNFFAGANPFTRPALLAAFNAEPSIAPAMAQHGYPAINSYDPALNPIYDRFALQFVAAHPLQWVSLGALKLATLIRPDTKAHALLSSAGLVKLLTSLCVPLWIAVLAFSRLLGRYDWIVVLFVLAYVFPFVLTNADPRFRPALDTLVLTHCAILILSRQYSSLSQSPQSLTS